ncbi:MAG: hypothetical protein GKR89_18885 [Candidatus Latescibacteria bacterium]|nr:hypothetical protein [Candidatus Latescibacterota bacterium]
MGKTTITIENESFLINGKATYSEISTSKPEAHGLLMNARFIQGIFDDKADPARFARWGHPEWNPAANTQALVDALPEWYSYGLRAFTVGFQGGGPCFTIGNDTIHNNPFGEDGTQLDPAYAERMDALIRGADEEGIAVIVSYFYGSQARRLKDGRAVRNAVVGASKFLKEGGYTNALIEIANEMNIGSFREHPIIREPEGMASLIDLAREASGGMAVGCSGGGGYRNREVAEASDYILIHGNGQTRQKYYGMIQEVKSWDQNKPIVCNEDSQAIGNMEVAYKTRTSWGYYNNMTKQEPPADWGVTKGEDTFFAHRMAAGISIEVEALPQEDHYYLQGFEPQMSYMGQRWIRLASLYPESISCVDFYRNGELYYTSYDESFAINFSSNWRFGGVEIGQGRQEWKAVIHLGNGDVLERTAE